MGIFSRLNTMIRSNLNAWVDKAEDPAKLVSQTLEDMEGEIKKARRELLTTVGNAKRLVKKRDELEEEAQQWERKAELAVREGDDDLARQALRRKARARSEAQDAARQAKDQESAAEEMKESIARAERKVEDLKNRKGTLAAQVKQARNSVTSDSSDASSRVGSSTFEELERMGGRVEQLDAEVEASRALDEDRRAETDARFRDLERSAEGGAVDDELNALKRKLDDR